MWKSLVSAAMIALLGVCATAFANPAITLNLHSLATDPATPVAAIRAPARSVAGQAVHISIYNDEAEFLETVFEKVEAPIDENGFAFLDLDLVPGEYAFVAYLDKNGDGMLNRGSFLGRPKEPIVFSNGIRPKLKRPSFSETKVDVHPGSVVVLDFNAG